MTPGSPVAALQQIAASFDRVHASRKVVLLKEIAESARPPARDLEVLHDVLCFLRAYPDDAETRRFVDRVTVTLRAWLEGRWPRDDSGLPHAAHHDVFALPVLARMERLFPGAFEIDWARFDEQDTLTTALGLLVTASECQALDDIHLGLEEWLAAARTEPGRSDLSVLLGLFETAPLDVRVRDALFDQCQVPVRYAARQGLARCEVWQRVARVQYQRRPFDKAWCVLASEIRRPFDVRGHVSRADGRALVDLGLRALCSRNLEIGTLDYANPRDVWLLPCGRGVQIALLGVALGYRDPLESHYCVVVLKNGVPVGYGPASVSLGCCEIGLNLFPEFRGAEVRFLYPQLMRTMHHVLGADYFFLTSYGMGDGNPAAIRTGAFWFYRKLGFRASSPEVEALAQAEEARMRAQPGYRSSPAMLRRLAYTEAHLDLSGGACRRLDHGAIGMRQTAWLAEEFDDDRALAEQRCMTRVSRVLRASPRSPGEARAWQLLAPLWCLLPDLARWSTREKHALVRIMRAKGRPSEAGVDRLIRRHPRLRESLYALTGSD